MNRKRRPRRLSQGALRNVRFADLLDLVQGSGFHGLRISGSHHIFGHPDIPELVNLQEVRGGAKPYHARQFLRLVERCNLALENGA